MCACSVTQLCLTLCDPMDRGDWQGPVRLFCLWDYPKQEHWSGLPLPTPGDLPELKIKPTSPALAGRFFTTVVSWEALK